MPDICSPLARFPSRRLTWTRLSSRCTHHVPFYTIILGSIHQPRLRLSSLSNFDLSILAPYQPLVSPLNLRPTSRIFFGPSSLVSILWLSRPGAECCMSIFSALLNGCMTHATVRHRLTYDGRSTMIVPWFTTFTELSTVPLGLFSSIFPRTSSVAHHGQGRTGGDGGGSGSSYFGHDVAEQ